MATTKNNSCQLEHQVIIEEIQRPIKIYEEEDPTLNQLSMHNHEPDAPVPAPSGSPSSQSRNTQRELGVEGRIFSQHMLDGMESGRKRVMTKQTHIS